MFPGKAKNDGEGMMAYESLCVSIPGCAIFVACPLGCMSIHALRIGLACQAACGAPAGTPLFYGKQTEPNQLQP